MGILRKSLPLVGLGCVFSAAHAQFAFSNISATYSMTPSSGTINWIVNQNASAMTIDFTGNAPPFKVGDSTGFSTGTSTITYNVTSTAAITSVDLTLEGDVELFGRVQYTEAVTSGANNLGSLSGSVLGSSYSGGTDGAFTRVLHLNFSQSATSFSVSQTLASDINGQGLPSTSVALVGTVEQNFRAVPEPASIACLAFGLGALVRLRRKR